MQFDALLCIYYSNIVAKSILHLHEHSCVYAWSIQDQRSSQSSTNSLQDDSLDLLDSLASSIDVDEAAKRCVLADKFHLTHFKDFQTNVINAVLNKRDTLSLVIQPTGSGKSLCFQFPAVYTKKTHISDNTMQPSASCRIRHMS